jgi:hypothetical protein
VITLERVRELVSYDPETGDFLRLVRVANQKAGVKAGAVNKLGYVSIRLDNGTYLGHRLAWFISYGNWPAQQIDHINRNRADNRLVNLREVSSSENKQNCGARSNNKIGIKGVHQCRTTGRWIAQIASECRYYYLGRFDTPELASEAYRSAAAKLHKFNPAASQTTEHDSTDQLSCA